MTHMAGYTLTNIDTVLWRQVKVHAAQKGVTVRAFILGLLETAIQQAETPLKSTRQKAVNIGAK